MSLSITIYANFCNLILCNQSGKLKHRCLHSWSIKYYGTLRERNLHDRKWNCERTQQSEHHSEEVSKSWAKFMLRKPSDKISVEYNVTQKLTVWDQQYNPPSCLRFHHYRHHQHYWHHHVTPALLTPLTTDTKYHYTTDTDTTTTTTTNTATDANDKAFGLFQLQDLKLVQFFFFFFFLKRSWHLPPFNLHWQQLIVSNRAILNKLNLVLILKTQYFWHLVISEFVLMFLLT